MVKHSGSLFSKARHSLALLWVFGWLIPVSCAEVQEVQRPNVILIMADDLGYETIASNGGTSYQTPELDKMARNGIRFEHCYAQPLCTPSRVKMMTGISNIRNYTDFGILHPSQTTFGHLFQDAGYSTCVVGKWQLGKDPQSPVKAGFDRHSLWQVEFEARDSTGRDTRYSQPLLQTDGELKRFGSAEYGPTLVTQYALDFIEQAKDDNEPFLLYYPMILTHCPFSPTPHSPEWVTDDSTVMNYKGRAHYFEDMVFTMDSIVGIFQRKLEALGILDNTLAIFTGDNGTDTPIVSQLNGRRVAGAKKSTTDAGTRVPLIAQWPGMIDKGTVSTDLIDFSDFFPTLCEVAGIDVPGGLDLDGVSFAPQLQGKNGGTRDWIYSWFIRNADDEPKVFARNQEYKLYGDGAFYHIPSDYDEKNPLNHEQLNQEQMSVYQKLDSVITGYGRRRLDAVPSLTN